MSIAPWMKPLRRAAAAAATLTLILAGTPALAEPPEPEDEDYDHVLNTDKRLMDGLLGVIGLKSTTPDITYRERSPLVVPPRRDLPLPEPNLAAQNPAWPVDPEVKQRKQAARARMTERAVDPAKPISGTGTGPRGVARDYGDGNDSMRKEPGFFTRLMNGDLFGKKDDEIGTFTGEPPRSSLLEPPPGYQTPSPAAPYGVTRRPGEVYQKQPKL